MKSRITIEVAFDDNNRPYIQCDYSEQSDDVRDKLILNFIERLGHTSSWCRIHFHGGGVIGGNSMRTCFSINAITPAELKAEAKKMLEQADLIEQYPRTDAVSH